MTYFMEMPDDFKINILENNYEDDLKDLDWEVENEETTSNEDKELTTVFQDMRESAFLKAVYISPEVKAVTLGQNASPEKYEEENVNCSKSEKIFDTAVLQTSTPEKNSSKNSVQHSNCLKIKKKLEKNLSPIEIENGIDYEDKVSFSKLLNEFDFQRRLTVDKVMRERIQNMYDTGKLIRDSFEHLKQTRLEEAIARRLFLERKILDDIHEQEIINKPKREAQWARDNLKEAQRIQERNQKVKDAEEEARKKSEAILLKRKLIDKILFELQREYNQEYKNVLETIKSCKDKTALAELTTVQSKSLKDCAIVCESLLKKCKQGDVTEDDVESAKKLVETVKSIHNCFTAEIEKINNAVPAEPVKVEEVKKTEQEPSLQKNKADDNSKFLDLSDCFDSKSFQTYMQLKNHLEAFRKNLEPLLEDNSMKKFRFNCQKAVTIPVNAISPISAAHLNDKYTKLHNLLSGRPVEVGDIKIAASQHPLGVDYCKYLLAKKFVRQGDLTVSSKPDAAFSIATILASLWIDFPDFGQLVLAHFQTACPYLAPVFMPQVEGQSDEDYHKSLGYHYSQNGEVEKQDSFLKRMSGIMRLYAALIISKIRQPGRVNPLGLSEGWRWISALLNLEPRADICATILYDFLEVAGNEMFRVYGGQFKKILAYICQEYFPKLEKVTPSTSGGPLVRLEGFLQKVLKEEFIPPPQGVLPPNFW